MKILLPFAMVAVLCTATAASPLSEREEQQIRQKIEIYAANQSAPSTSIQTPTIIEPSSVVQSKPDPLDSITIRQIQDAGRIIESIRGNIPTSDTSIQTNPVVVNSTTVSIPAEVRDGILSLCGLLITGAIGWSLTWMKAHFKFMQEVGANATITASATGLGALLEKELATQGKSLASVDVNNPTVAHFAQLLIDSFPEWSPLVGLTPELAKRKVLDGGLVQSRVPVDATLPSVEIVNQIQPA